jgi:ribonucleoside-diphosphate reductase alpha chain
MVEKIRKRDGRIVSFNPEKIKNALYRAAKAAGIKDFSLAQKFTQEVVGEVERKFKNKIPGVEDIQDIVEKVLIKNDLPDVAKAYILYREKRREVREVKRFLGVKDDLKLSVNALQVLKKRYLLRNEKGEIMETPKKMFERVAKALALVEKDYGDDPEAAYEKFFEVMKNLEFLPNSPTLMNAGTEIGQLSACFVIPVEDSLEGIFNAVKYMALIQKSGGGTGFSFSSLRPAGDVVKSTMGIASGPVSFMRVFDITTDVIKQGGKRRGANMGILKVDHPDIFEFITAKREEGNLANFNISVAVTDEFMEAVKKDKTYFLINPRNKKKVKEVKARAVFDLIVANAWRTGDPGLVFIDEVNRKNPTLHLGEIESTNPCIVGETLIPTEFGLLKMKELVKRFRKGEIIKIAVDPRMAKKARLLKEGTYNISLTLEDSNSCYLLPISQAFYSGKKETLKITTLSGYELVCTPEHRIMTDKGWIEARNLKPRFHKILIQSKEGFFNQNHLFPFRIPTEFKGRNGRTYKYNFPKKWSYELGLVLGWLIGDGWLRSGDKNCRVGFSFGKDDDEILNLLKPILNKWYGQPIKEVQRSNGVYHLSYHSKFFVEFFEKLGVKPTKASEKDVPESIFTAPKEAVIGFLQGIFTSEGTVRDNPKSNSSWIALTSKSKKLLQSVQLLLLNFGIKSTIFNRGRGVRKGIFKYTTIKGRGRSYDCDGVLFELGLFGAGREKFKKEIGFLNKSKQKRLENIRFQNFNSLKFNDLVVSVEESEVRDVYDLTEPLTHSMIANGLVIHQCGEQPLLPFESCNLGSINLSKMVKNGKIDWERLREVTEIAVHFLDNVIDANKFPLPQIEEVTKKNRKIGLGVMGFAELLILLGIPYDSEEALKLAEKIMKFIKEVAHEKSQEMAKKRGSFLAFKGSIWERLGYKSMRNATCTTVAPTGTISIIAGTSSGIEPLFALSFVRDVLEGTKLLEINPIFEKVAKEKGFYSRELMMDIAKSGSIAERKEIPEEVRRVFRTALDISPDWHVKMQAAFQKYTDNAVSKTVNLPNDATPEDVRRIYMLAYELKCKGITVYRYGSKKEQVLYLGNLKGEEKLVSAESEYSGGCPATSCPF